MIEIIASAPQTPTAEPPFEERLSCLLADLETARKSLESGLLDVDCILALYPLEMPLEACPVAIDKLRYDIARLADPLRAFLGAAATLRRVSEVQTRKLSIRATQLENRVRDAEFAATRATAERLETSRKADDLVSDAKRKLALAEEDRALLLRN